MTSINNQELKNLLEDIALSNKEQYEIKGGVGNTDSTGQLTGPSKIACKLHGQCNMTVCMSGCTVNCMTSGCVSKGTLLGS